MPHGGWIRPTPPKRNDTDYYEIIPGATYATHYAELVLVRALPSNETVAWSLIFHRVIPLCLQHIRSQNRPPPPPPSCLEPSKVPDRLDRRTDKECELRCDVGVQEGLAARPRRATARRGRGEDEFSRGRGEDKFSRGRVETKRGEYEFSRGRGESRERKARCGRVSDRWARRGQERNGGRWKGAVWRGQSGCPGGDEVSRRRATKKRGKRGVARGANPVRPSWAGTERAWKAEDRNRGEERPGVHTGRKGGDSVGGEQEVAMERFVNPVGGVALEASGAVRKKVRKGGGGEDVQQPRTRGNAKVTTGEGRGVRGGRLRRKEHVPWGRWPGGKGGRWGSRKSRMKKAKEGAKGKTQGEISPSPSREHDSSPFAPSGDSPSSHPPPSTASTRCSRWPRLEGLVRWSR